MSESPKRGARTRRQVKTTATAAKLAARVAGEKYLGLPIPRDSHARALTQALGALKGPLMKVGQFLSAIPGALPEEYRRELATLQAEAPAMGGLFASRRMAAELGPDWRAKFENFEKTACKAASLGQVHRAVSLDGRALACKLQYPDMKTAVEADLAQLRFMLAAFGKFDGALETDEILAELAERLHEELDYAREAKHLALFADILADEAGVHVPQVLPELSTPRLLSMTWLEGLSLPDYVAAHPKARDALARTMFRIWYRPFWECGIIHGDPHPGNYTVREDAGLNLLDFGCVRIFPPRFVLGVLELWQALRDEDFDRTVHAYELWGFAGLTRELVETLNTWARFLYAPLLKDAVCPIGTAEHGFYGKEVLIGVHRALKKAGGGVVVPREFVFMDRAALGLGSLFIRLGAEENWHRLFADMIGNFDVEALEKRQEVLLAKYNLL